MSEIEIINHDANTGVCRLYGVHCTRGGVAVLLLVTVCHVSVLCDEVLIVDRIHLFLHRATCMISCGNVRFVPVTSENRDCYNFCLFVCLCEHGWYVLCNTRKYFQHFT